MQTVSRRRFLEGSAAGIAAGGLGVCSLHGQDWARQAVDKSPRRREWVSVKHDGRSVECFIAHPESRAKAPVMVVIHEIFGMTDWVESVTDEFAAAGYLASLPICSPVWARREAARRTFQRMAWDRRFATCRRTRSPRTSWL
jgi:hypothetical protein